jgi:hypothetical protein
MSQRHGKRDWLMAAGLAAVVIVAGSWRMRPSVRRVSTMRFALDGGIAGQRRLPADRSPAPLNKYLFLYPALLAVVWSIWPDFPPTCSR